MSKEVGGWIYDWNTPNGSTQRKGPPRPFQLDDETIRDGLQSPSAKTPPLQAKLEFLHILVDLGIEGVDIGLPAASATNREDSLFLAKEIARGKLPLVPNCAARTMKLDIQPIVEISQQAGIAVEVAAFIGSSAVRRYAEGWDLPFLLRRTKESVTAAVCEGLPVMFVAEDATRATPDVLRQLVNAALECGARRICLADTVGFASPAGVLRLLTFVRKLIAEAGVEAMIDWHGHMDRGLGLANSLVALEAGADRIHGSALGLGERVGNTPMDLLLVNLKMMEWWRSDLSRLKDYVEWVPRYTGVTVPWNYPVFGRDAYRTGTGIHAAAILKALNKGDQDLVDIVYSAIPACWVGRQQIIEVSPMSGESNVIFWLRKHGVEPSPEKVRGIRKLAKDSDHTLSDDEIWDFIKRMDKP
jgi:2-isopropylmalate synthase